MSSIPIVAAQDLVPISKDELDTIENDLNSAALPTAGYVATLELNCTETGDEIIVRVIHSTGLILGDASVDIHDDDEASDVYELCETAIFEILAESRTNFRPSVLRQVLALYDLDSLTESLAIVRPSDIPWGWSQQEKEEK